MTLKLILSGLFLVLFSTVTSAQLTNGLVAHWSFNGNSGDSSGNGYHGTANNITYTQGKTGLNNTAALFNGTSSYIDVSYKPGMNLSDFSICAMVRIDGYYTGLCEVSVILGRGLDHTSGHYSLILSDNAADGSNCGMVDTSKYCFYSAVRNKNQLISNLPWYYTPSIVSSNWYCVVSTYGNDTNKIYVDGVLKSAVGLPSGSIGSSTDSMSIGANRHGDVGLYPYWLKGAIDDLRLYNRALSASEVSMFCSIVSSVEDNTTSNDEHISLYPNPNSGSFTITGNVKPGVKMNIRILNATGQVVYNEQLRPQSNRFKKDIITADFPAGLYLLKAEIDGTTQVQRFVISK